VTNAKLRYAIGKIEQLEMHAVEKGE
jgi:hypothetical protein